MVVNLKKIDHEYFVNSIRKLAEKSLKSLNPCSRASKEARLRIKRPVDYLRCAEFTASLEQMELKDGNKILDVGSPQWFSLLLARDYPSSNFFYLNILKTEIDNLMEISRNLGIKNLHYIVGDVRNLCFPSSFFDNVLSISVIEHIAPEKEGDYIALKEIARVVKPDGKITFSIPLKERERVIYMNGPVYERKDRRREFFAREYNLEHVESLIKRLNLKICKINFIIEKKGIFALDYWRWGDGRKNPMRVPILGSIKIFEKIGFSLEEKIAKRYLFLSNTPEKGVICSVLTVKKGEM